MGFLQKKVLLKQTVKDSWKKNHINCLLILFNLKIKNRRKPFMPIECVLLNNEWKNQKTLEGPFEKFPEKLCDYSSFTFPPCDYELTDFYTYFGYIKV